MKPWLWRVDSILFFFFFLFCFYPISTFHLFTIFIFSFFTMGGYILLCLYCVMFSPSSPSSFCFPPFFSFVSFSATCDVLPPSPFSLFYLFFPVRYLNFYFGYNSFLILDFSPSKLWSSRRPLARVIQHSPWRPYMIDSPLPCWIENLISNNIVSISLVILLF